MNKELRDKIFEPFFTSKGVGKGTGLGLSVVNGIIHKHKGAINVYSEFGKGSVFTFYFPLKETAVEKKRVKEDIIVLGAGETILVIEDEEIIIHMLKRMLDKNNYKGLFAGTLSEAKKIYKAYYDKIDIVLCDMILPDSDGIKIIKELNTIEPVKRIIYSSGYLDEQSRWKEIQKDKIPFVQKPFSMNKLMKVIAKSLKK